MSVIFTLKIEEIYPLTPEEIAVAIAILKQWRGALFSKTTTDRINAISLIDRAYEYVGWSKTPVVFTRGVKHSRSLIDRGFADRDNHHSAIDFDNYQGLLRRINELMIGKEDCYNSYGYIKEASALSDKHLGLDRILGREADILQYSYEWLHRPLEYLIDYHTHKTIDIDLLFINNSYEQYFIEQLDLTHDPEGWDIIANLNQECPYLLPVTKFCLVIDRPKEVYLDRELLPHAEDRAAMKFRDGTKLYFYHGTAIPPKYGKLPQHRWKPKWLLSEDRYDLRNILTFAIGCKKFRKALPNVSYDFWQDLYPLIKESIDIIISWQLYHLEGLYLKQPQTARLCLSDSDVKSLTKHLPIELPIELYCLYEFYNGGYQLCPGLQFYPLERTIAQLPNFRWLRSPESGYPFPLFQGKRSEIYFITISNRKTNSARVYCQFPDREATLYAECITSLIVTIGQCYREGAYELTIDSASGQKNIRANSSIIESIFDKFNPDSIDRLQLPQYYD